LFWGSTGIRFCCEKELVVEPEGSAAEADETVLEERSAAADTFVSPLNTGAEEELVRLYHGRIRLMAYLRTRDREAARDLAQETMLAVIRNLRDGRLLDPDKLPNYISGTARNLINNYLRLRRRRPEDGPPSEEIPAPELEPEVERSERRFLARRALSRLRPEDRLILLLTLVDGLEPAQIAERLGMSPEVVRKRKSRAVERAREVLGVGSRR
jgi:RNA polymerase sigma-70 factor (ECF subfamily)